MRLAGIDIGSRTIKVVVVEDGEIVFSYTKENTFDTINDCKAVLEGLEYDEITSTGYGRHVFAQQFENVNVVSEIKAFSVGVNHLYPNARTILDIGGQDTKAISISEKGAILKFEMNDKCAAGTGRFLEIMSMALCAPLNEFGDLALLSQTSQSINSMCTVFAESEVVSLLSKGVKREDIACGILQSIIIRASSQLKRVGVTSDVVFVGGVAKNRAMVKLLADKLQTKIYTPENPQIIGALGAALCCR